MEAKFLFYVFKGLSLLPLASIHSLGVALGWLFYLIPNRERETARINIGLCLLQFFSAPDGIADPDPERAAEALNKGVEACVRRCPSQYQWPYKRFKGSPEGVSSPYRKGGD